MAGITHHFVSTVSDSPGASKVGKDRWNEAHDIADGYIVKAKLEVANVQNFLVPAGGIIMWSGTIATIPSGWLLCNGSNGTPDLRDKFIVGAKQDDAGVAKTNITASLLQTGGGSTHTHEHAHVHALAEHGHLIGTHTHKFSHAHASPIYIGTTNIRAVVNNSLGSSGLYPSVSMTRRVAIEEDNQSEAYALTGLPELSGDAVIETAIPTSGGATGTMTGSHDVGAASEETTGAGTSLPTFFALAFIMKSAVA